jgi:leucyl aminopeptidase
MKKIIDVKILVWKGEPAKIKTDMLCAGVFSGEKQLDKTNKTLDRKLGGKIERLIKLGDFKGEEESSAVLYTDGKLPAERLMLVGLGEKKKATQDSLRRACSFAANKAVTMKIKKLSLAIHKAFDENIEPDVIGRVCTEGAYFGSYRYDEYITKSENGRESRLDIELVEENEKKAKRITSGCNLGTIIGQAQGLARTLANRPGNVINPPALAGEAKKIARRIGGLTCTVFDKGQLVRKKMGGILAVGAGSKSEPRLLVLKYNGAGKTKNKPAVALVGKAITFDSGGISIKPAQNMEAMKLDKSGGIAVLATLVAAAKLKLPINLYGLIPAAENLPSGTSYRPGDIVTTYSGKTVEVQNTDAEGRMILCDALHYAVEQKCETIVDIATLTGSCVVALGQYKAGLFGNDENLIEQLRKASEQSGENIWYMPSGDEYAKEMKSKIADLKNVGSKWGGACTAAAFLKQFIGKAKWAHLDIAGVDIFEDATAYSAEGASGFGVRLLITFLLNLAKKK